jgi:hypothetical protein
MLINAVLEEALNQLIRKYREVAFSDWETAAPPGGHHFNDYASCAPEDHAWWQADTDALEVITDPDGRKWANVSIVLYPRGVHSLPPALAASLTVYDDGLVQGSWANGLEFEFKQARNDVVLG